MGTRIVKDAATGRRYRLALNNEVKPMTFSEAAADLERLVKSRRREQSLREMSDSKDYMESDADDFDRAPQGARRKDMRASNREWAGIQALDEDIDFLEMDADLIHEMLVSGRPSKIRFPGARGDSRIEPIQDQHYVMPDDEDEDAENLPEGRAAIGGDRVARRVMRRGEDSNEYVRGKSFGMRGRGFTPMDLLKSRDAIKSRLSQAMFDEQIEPTILMNYEGAFTEQRLGFNVDAAMRALAQVSPRVRKAYGIPTISGNQWEEMGRIRRGA
jgi:hypothetical protein